MTKADIKNDALQKFHEALRLKGRSWKTIKSYKNCVANYIDFIANSNYPSRPTVFFLDGYRAAYNHDRRDEGRESPYPPCPVQPSEVETERIFWKQRKHPAKPMDKVPRRKQFSWYGPFLQRLR